MRNFRGVFAYMMVALVVTGTALTGGKWADNRSAELVSTATETESTVVY